MSYKFAKWSPDRFDSCTTTIIAQFGRGWKVAQLWSRSTAQLDLMQSSVFVGVFSDVFLSAYREVSFSLSLLVGVFGSVSFSWCLSVGVFGSVFFSLCLLVSVFWSASFSWCPLVSTFWVASFGWCLLFGVRFLPLAQYECLFHHDLSQCWGGPADRLTGVR